MGLRPKTPNERLEYIQKTRTPKRAQQNGDTRQGAAILLHSFFLSEFKRLAWGFGAQPQMGTQGQSKDNVPNSLSPWGEAPIKG